uniref:Catalytic n=1 Tax=Rhizophora mucronata TaxID=61149 RepID=A0A2P2LJC3_RHIMU
MKNEASYILFKDFRNPVLYHGGNLDLEILNKGISTCFYQGKNSFCSILILICLLILMLHHLQIHFTLPAT